MFDVKQTETVWTVTINIDFENLKIELKLIEYLVMHAQRLLHDKAILNVQEQSAFFVIISLIHLIYE